MKDQFGYDFDFDQTGMGHYLSPGGDRTPIQADSERLVNEIINAG